MLRVSIKAPGPVALAVIAALGLHAGYAAEGAPRAGASAPLPPPAASPPPDAWVITADGLEVALRQAGSALVVLVRVDPDRAALRVMRPPAGAITAADAADLVDAAAVINGGFFDADGRPIGWLVADGRVLSPPGNAGWGAFVVRAGRPGIVGPGAPSARGVSQAVQAGPRLVVGGKPNPRLKRQSARRSFIGLDAAGRVVLGTTGPSSVDAGDLASFLARAESDGGAGLVEALNLDGGSSAQLHVRGVPGGDLDFAGVPVPVVIAVMPSASLE